MKTPRERDFLEYYADQFDAGAVNRSNYLECAAYMQGLRDAMTSELSDEALRRFERVESLLQGAANVIEVLRRERVKVTG